MPQLYPRHDTLQMVVRGTLVYSIGDIFGLNEDGLPACQ